MDRVNKVMYPGSIVWSLIVLVRLLGQLINDSGADEKTFLGSWFLRCWVHFRPFHFILIPRGAISHASLFKL